MEIKNALDFAQEYLDYDIAELEDTKNRLGKKKSVPGERTVEILEDRIEIFKTIIQTLKNEQKRLELLNETKLKLKLSRNKGWAKSVTILVNIVHALETLEGVEVSDEG